MGKDLISAIFPCYNVAKFLPDLFKSLDKMNYENVEYIFVNDGSKDNTLELLKTYCQNRSNCHIVDQENQKLCMARNNGLKAAKGKYIWFCDPDDIPSPHLLSVLQKNMVEHSADISICGYQKVKEEFHFDNVPKFSQKKKVEEYNQLDAMCQYLSCKKFDLNVWCKLYKHEILKKFPNYPNVFNPDIKYGEDVAFNTEYLTHIEKCIFDKRKLYFYRQRANSLVHSKFNENRLTTFIGIDNAIKLYKKDYPEASKYAKSLKGLVSVEMLYYIYKGDYDNKEKIKELLHNLKSNMKYIVHCRRNHLSRRLFVPLTYPLFKLFLSKRLKNKKKCTK